MNKRTGLFGILIAIWLMTSLACGLPTSFGGSPGGTPGSDATANPGLPGLPLFSEATATLPPPTPTPTPTPIPEKPVSMFSGLASLDSYQTSMRFFTSGPGPNTLSETLNEVQFNRANGATRNTITTKMSSEDSPEVETSSQEQVTVDLETCTLEEGAWEYSKMQPQEKEILSIFSNLYDLLPVISNPTFIATENKNGIDANHFSFKVETAGAESGSVVAVNEGEYWLAVDGQYLVAYSLRLELRSAPASDTSAEVNRLEIDYSLVSANQPVDIQLPEGCAP